MSKCSLGANWDIQRAMSCATTSDRAKTPVKEYSDAKATCMNEPNCRGFQDECGRYDEFYLCNADSQLIETSNCGSNAHILKGYNIYRNDRKASYWKLK